MRIGDYPDFWDSLEGIQFAENGDLLLACDQTHGVADQNTGEGWPPGKLRMTRLSTDGDTIWYDKFYPRGCGACTIEELSTTIDNGALMTLDDIFLNIMSPGLPFCYPVLTGVTKRVTETQLTDCRPHFALQRK